MYNLIINQPIRLGGGALKGENMVLVVCLAILDLVLFLLFLKEIYTEKKKIRRSMLVKHLEMIAKRRR